MLRVVLVALGLVFLGLGALGAVLPVLPTTPFVLLAAACFARGSDRIYQWLLKSRLFGPMILDWRERRSVARKTKVWAATLIVITFSISVIFCGAGLAVRISLATLGVALLILIWRLPSEGSAVSEAGPAHSEESEPSRKLPG